ncbi:M1 family metallopeptidase [Mucilaginibacter sp. SP1R1]|uniref:M1 family metallopeptidase n=1 Tax=Mucilaginibacter sp. SP1R1 TaxID=2723091 RepID=UPI0017A14FAF|nr:M1 family aminopeptidase [Mucilaginibacter sp. SP1R1]MBB6148944.1 aminopeptidase N [Mucilaginibacter sp. SP1R1]
MTLIKKRTVAVIILFLTISSTLMCNAQSTPPLVEPGVSLELARYRRAVISNLQYTLDLNIPASKDQDIDASESVEFTLKSVKAPLQLDFKQNANKIHEIQVNNKNIPVDWQKEHLLIAQQYLRIGKNKISLQFATGDQSLNRNDDYLYALFVPDRARTVFACFDQPDLKANFVLSLNVPADWKVLANAGIADTVNQGQKTKYQFNKSDKLSTYLFSFAAGRFSSVKQMINNKPAEFLYRETDTAKIKLSVDSIFTAHRDAISFLQQWTGIPFPFQKIGFVAIPDFQFGGMEHPGEVQYKASGVFLDNGATKDMIIARSNLLSHETAHMWFGDMVTMEWFNDVWMKEVFANFMADKITEKMMGSETFSLKFLQDHYPAAYSIDRTQGANPIRQDLDNLKDAGSLYGNIIYHKAPIMMRQLELLMGKEEFKQGIRAYLKKYAYGNATWNDLIAILSKHTTADLYSWNKVWVNQPGRPVFDYDINYKAGRINKFTIRQTPEFGPMRIWPQTFNVTLAYKTFQKNITVDMNSAVIDIKQASGLDKPLYVIFNTNGIGYGLFPVDKSSIVSLFIYKDAIERASLYITAYENMLGGRYFKPGELLAIFEKGLISEKDETNLRLLSGYISNIYWEFITPAVRKQVVAELETNLWSAMQQQQKANNKKVLFKSYQDIYTSAAAGNTIYTIWKQQKPPAGVKLTEDDFTSLALTIALKSDTETNVLKQQEDRINNIDRKKRLEFLMPALSLNEQERDRFFASLQDHKNRQKEAWVTTAMVYLHHPLRQKISEKYLAKSLDMLEEIQKTGDIFFPQSWLQTILGYYQDKQAAAIVNEFLNSHKSYNPKLKAKILQSEDNLFRAQKLVP